MTYHNPQTTDPNILDEAEETPQIRLARDLATGVEASPAMNQVGRQAAEQVAPDEDDLPERLHLDEGDLSDYDQEKLAEEREKDDKD